MSSETTPNRSVSSETLNTRIVDDIVIEPETCAHVLVKNKVQTCTTADIEVAIDYVAVFEHDSSRTTQSVDINVSTSAVETIGFEHED